MNRKGYPMFTAYSAGSHLAGAVRLEALREIEKAGLSTANLRSKPWVEFAKPDSHRCISSSRFAIRPRTRCARIGLDNR
jgi:hypothetical protein